MEVIGDQDGSKRELRAGDTNEIKPDGSIVLAKSSLVEIYKAYSKIWDRTVPTETMDCMERTILSKKGCLTKSDKCPIMNDCQRFQMIIKECIPEAIAKIEQERMRALVESIVTYLRDKI